MNRKPTIRFAGLCSFLCGVSLLASAASAADTTAPTVTCSVRTPILSSTDHRFVDVGLAISTQDDVDPTPRTGVRVFSNEDDDETGSGNFSPDARFVPPQVLLRAERNGAGKGRVYVIVVTATDAAGNSASSFCTVVVPRDQSPASQAQVQQLAAQVTSLALPPPGYTTVGDGPDKSAFRVALTSPPDGASFPWGVAISLSANASFTATKVEYYDGFNKIGEATAAPYPATLLNSGPGLHVIEAIATSSNGERYSSNAVSFAQRPNLAPTIGLTAPSVGAVFQLNEPIQLKATAADADGSVTKVEFFAGATKIGEAGATPYSILWSSATPGVYSLTAAATDTAGAFVISSVRTIRVNAPPMVTISEPRNASTFETGQTIVVSVSARDDDGSVQKVEFFSGAGKIGETTAPPFTFNWSGAGPGAHRLSAIATDNTGAFSETAVVDLVVNEPPPPATPTPSPAATVTPTPVPTPAAINDLKATRASSMRANLTWTDRSAGVATLAVERSSDNGATWQSLVTLPPVTTSFSDLAAPQSQFFYYRVITITPEGARLFSNFAASDESDPGATDSDEDGLTDADEIAIYRTNPRNNDSDYDATGDGDEVEQGADPNDPSSYPPRLRTVGRGVHYEFSPAGWNGEPYRTLRWSGDWENAPGDFEEGTDPRGVTTLDDFIAGKAPFPQVLGRQRDFGFYTGGATAYSNSFDLGDGVTVSAVVGQLRMWLHRYPATAREARLPVLVITRRSVDTAPASVDLRVQQLSIAAGATTSEPLDLLNSLTQEFGPGEPHNEYVVQDTRIINVVVREKGRSAPRDGVLIETYSRLQVGLNGGEFDNARELDDQITWQYCQLQRDGAYTAWKAIPLDNREISFATGTRFEWQPFEAGIFKIRATISTDTGPQYFEYLRKRDEPFGGDSAGNYNEMYRAGQPDFVGIVDWHLQIDVRNEARRNLGSTKYASTFRLPDGTVVLGQELVLYKDFFGDVVMTEEDNKCNAFVYHKASDGGAIVPLTRAGRIHRFPPTAYDWWDVRYLIGLWTRLPDDVTIMFGDEVTGYPQPGFVVARPDSRVLPGGKNVGPRWGHVGILDYDGAWIQAGSRNVNKYPHLKDAHYQPAGLRQYLH